MDVLGNPDDSMSKMPDGALSIVNAECTAIGPPSRRKAKENLTSFSQANWGHGFFHAFKADAHPKFTSTLGARHAQFIDGDGILK